MAKRFVYLAWRGVDADSGSDFMRSSIYRDENPDGYTRKRLLGVYKDKECAELRAKKHEKAEKDNYDEGGPVSAWVEKEEIRKNNDFDTDEDYNSDNSSSEESDQDDPTALTAKNLAKLPHSSPPINQQEKKRKR